MLLSIDLALIRKQIHGMLVTSLEGDTLLDYRVWITKDLNWNALVADLTQHEF